MTPAILGIGTAVPAGSIAQEDALVIARRFCNGDAEAARLLGVLYRRTSVDRRGSVLIENRGGPSGQSFFQDPVGAADRGPTTAMRLERYVRDAPDLACDAASRALKDSGVRAREITHLVTASCTGFRAPGPDLEIVRRLGLSPRISRTHVGFMGCHGAINALRAGAAFAAAEPESRVLVCAFELCSLHYQYAPDPQQMVANAIFADGAAAAVVGAGTGTRLAAFDSCLMPDSADAMTWTIGDHGFEMTLSPRVPDLIASRLGPWVREWLGSRGLSAGDVASWAIHPGGPRILTAAGAALGLPEEALAASREVLAAHGNMSSPTVLFILDRIRRQGRRGPCVALAFGPGLVVEGMLLNEPRA